MNRAEVNVHIAYETDAPDGAPGISTHADVLVDEMYYLTGDDPLAHVADELRAFADRLDAHRRSHGATPESPEEARVIPGQTDIFGGVAS